MPAPLRPVNEQQSSRWASPWSARHRIGLLLWRIVYTLLIRPTPKPLNRWRLLWLGVFGARISGLPFVHQSARIWAPWHLTLEHRACLGEEVDVYNLGMITVRAGATVAQQVYLCAGSHDFDHPDQPLTTAPIDIGPESFIGVRALVLPGVTIGAHSIVGAGSVVTRDVPAGVISAGNPCRVLRQRSPKS